MQPKIPPLAAAGVAALGLCWASSVADGSTRLQDPAAPAPSSSPAIPSPSPAPAPEAQGPPTVLLKTDGDVLFGEVLEDPSGYYVKHRIGPRHVPRRNTLGVFHSLEEAYEFRKARVPANDADEQLDLARWCLGLELEAQAKVHLEAVLAVNPESRQAASMLHHLASGGGPGLDPALARTSGEVPADDPMRPRELNPSTLDQLRALAANSRGPGEPPVIFDLPPALALRRYQEFAGGTHLLIQNRCAQCHDADRHAGGFRVVRARNRRDLMNDPLVRTNLDATLRLVDQEDPSRSELLRVAGLSHPTDGRPILSGPNDPLFQALKGWVTSLDDPAQADAQARAAGYSPTPTAATTGGEGFAVDRFGDAPVASDPEPILPASTPPPAPKIVDQFIAVETAVSPSVPAGTVFPEPGLPNVAPPAGLPEADAPRKPGSIITREDGSQAMVLPDGSLADYVSPTERMKAKPKPVEPEAPATTPVVPTSTAPAPAPAPGPANPPAPAGPQAKAPAVPVPTTPAEPTVPKADRGALEKFLRRRSGAGG